MANCILYFVLLFVFFFFFFQAEDGIRDHCVTGVQTCALPIFRSALGDAAKSISEVGPIDPKQWDAFAANLHYCPGDYSNPEAYARSEERRVGKECRSRGSTDH